jgi:hypothetical protein
MSAAPASSGAPREAPVLEVPRADERRYRQRAYHDYVRRWNALVGQLSEASRRHDRRAEARLSGELRRFWPAAEAIAEAPWAPAADRERPAARAWPGQQEHC